MFMQNDIEIAKAAGPHLEDPRIDAAKRKAHLDKVLEIANRHRRSNKRLGEFSFAPAREDNDGSYFAQIRAVAPEDNCEFRYNMPAQNMGNYTPEQEAGNLLRATVIFKKLRGLKRWSQLTRKMADDLIESATHGIAPMRLIAVGATVDYYESCLQTTIDLEMLGYDLRVGIDRVTIRSGEDFDEKLQKLVDRHLAREKLLRASRASRAIGWIDGAAIRIIDAAGLPMTAVIGHMRDNRLLEFNFGGEEGYDYSAALFWEDGVIVSDARPLSNDWSFDGDRLTMLKPALPATVLTTLVGRRFGEVFEHPFIPADAIIIETAESGDWFYLAFAIGTRLVDDSAGLPREDDRVR